MWVSTCLRPPPRLPLPKPETEVVSFVPRSPSLPGDFPSRGPPPPSLALNARLRGLSLAVNPSPGPVPPPLLPQCLSPLVLQHETLLLPITSPPLHIEPYVALCLTTLTGNIYLSPDGLASECGMLPCQHCNVPDTCMQRELLFDKVGHTCKA
jgi:hypothetical protein